MAPRKDVVARGLLILLAILGNLQSLQAIPKSEFYKFGSAVGDQKLPRDDDAASPDIKLRSPLIFYGQIYESIYININGFVSFLTEIPNFFNVQFPLEYPLIAPFYSDVDTYSAGNIWYRETSDPVTVSRARDDLTKYFSQAKDFNPEGIFIVTWDGVGPFSRRADRLNTYQLVLITDGKESYALFHYADGGLQWLQSDGKDPNMADARGQAGLISGDGRFFTLKGSGTDQVRSLDKWSNTGEPGLWMYRIGQVALDENVHPPDLAIGLDEQSPGSSGATSCSSGGSICHSNSVCHDHDPGFCCACVEGYFGNGINCIKEAEPLRVTGKVTGTVNGVELKDADLHSYVLTEEGRTYTAVSRVPSQIGYDIQSITVFATGIAWLFAKPIGDVPNGFVVTGGSMNRTVEVEFPQTGHLVVIHQLFKGLDVFNNVEVNTQITGSVPTIPLGTKLDMDAFNEEYTRVKSGQVRARSNRVFRLQGQTIDTPFTVQTTIDYDECQWKIIPPHQTTVRLKIAENIFIQYDGPEQIVRYALSAKVSPLEEEDPCVEGRQECGQNSQCVVDGDNFRCVCERGYEEVYDSTLNDGICLDLNECDSGRDNCHVDAICVNGPGTFSCSCRKGFVGDGYTCTREASCEGIPCDTNAECDLRGPVPKCSCRPGFTGDGFFCSKEEAVVSVDEQRNCIDNDICSPYADCLYDDAVRGFRCACFPGYSGDGRTCTPDAQRESCDTARNCSPYGVCAKKHDGFVCECLPAFTGDGYTCDVDESGAQGPPYQPQPPYLPPDQELTPYETPDQVYPYDRPDHSQQLPYGSEDSFQRPYQPEDTYQVPYQPEDTYQVPYQPEDTYQVPYQPEDNYEGPYQPGPPYGPPYQIPDQGHSTSDEYTEPECLFAMCWCPGGYTLNNLANRCEPEGQSYIHPVPDQPVPYCSHAKCICPEGYIYNSLYETCEVSFDRVESRPLPSCRDDGRCSCTWGYDYDYTRQLCLPNNAPGYDYSIKGGGNRAASCNEVNTCHPNAQCVYERLAQTYKCVCNAGYEGNGYTCNSRIDLSCDRVNICHFNAQCIYDDQALRHVCVCQAGYQGDGQVCTPQDECSSLQDCDANAQCLYESSSRRYKCQCNDGYEGDGRVCTAELEAGCNIVNTCDAFADCIYDSYALRHRCQCRSGYEGDGSFCTATQVGCNVVYNCGDNAECNYDLGASGYRCKCRDGFSGDGFFCQSSRSCQQDPSVCHPQASCQSDVLSPFGMACKCLDGFTGDGYTCQEAPDHEKNLLLINQGLSVLRMAADPQAGRGYPIHVDPFMTAVGTDMDCLAGRYYWTDVRSSSIRSSKYDGREKKPIISGESIGSPEDVAVDWIAGNVYWTDSENDVVSAASIESGTIRTIIDGNLVNPRGIAVHPGKGLLFWSDWNREGAKIEVSGMDGSNRRTLVQRDIVLPNSLTVDYDTETLCWVDAGTHKIECIDMDGNGRRVVMEGAKYPFGLTTLGQNFYYTDWNDTKIHTVNRYSGIESGSRDPPPGGSGKLYGIVAVPPVCPPVSNVCGVNGGNCPDTHLCLPNGRGGRTCACSDEAKQGDCIDYHH